MFWTRLASGIVMLAIAITTLSLGDIPLAAVLWAISMIGFRELSRVFCGGMKPCRASVPGNTESERTARIRGGKVDLMDIIGFAGITAFYLLLYFSGSHTWLLMTIVFVFLAVMFAYVAAFPKFKAARTAETIFAFLYVPVMLSFVYQTRMYEEGIYMVWMILISSWGCDTFAYVVGKLVGKKRIFPVLSPKKSLEGCIGGVLGTALLGWLYGFFLLERVMPERNIAWATALICGAGAVAGMVGDLAASAVKRNFEIKDYGRLIPGHGGIMDRFDSMIVTAPMIYFLTILLLDL